MTDRPGAKKWPPISAITVAFALVFLVLPNPLRIPQNNPQTAAEYAPVPGNQQESQDSNFSQTNAADSAGIGSGGTGSGALPGLPPPPPPPQFKPRQKACVGNPPKQTEDPLSPPCVPFFDGDNGGPTYTGVTKDAITIAFYNDLGVKGDMTKPWQPSDENPGSESDNEHAYLVRTIMAQLLYFTRRYQTYGRRVNVLAKPSKGLGSPCPQRTADSYIVRKDLNPFAVVHFGDNGQCFLESMAKDFKVPGFGLNADVPQAEFDDYRPYIWGFYPPQEVETKHSASFICNVLAGQPAHFAKDTALSQLPRKFAIIHPERDIPRGPSFYDMSQQLMSYAKTKCGVQFIEKTFQGGGQANASSIMQSLKAENVTTVVCYCVPVPQELTVGTMQQAAAGINYHPEWYWDGASRMFRAIWEKNYGDPNVANFGTNYHWRNGRFDQQRWYKAYKEIEPSSVPNLRFNFDIYHLFLNLFQGLQGAGPNLTPETVERGMFTFNYLDRNDPTEPVGGYGPYDGQAIADYNFIDTTMGWWWDPQGTPPGGKAGDGCIRVMNQGKRYFPSEWPKGDGQLFASGAPCSQDDTQLQTGSASF